jgi:hypothetical protein
MAYYDVAALARDQDFLSRVTAAYSQELTAAGQLPLDPWSWVYQRQWTFASMPGFGDAYASALASGNPAPGQDPAVISDAQILSAVQYVMNPPAPEEPEVEPITP